MRRALLVLLLLPFVAGTALADQSFTMHVGTRADGTMYASPSTLAATAGEKVALTVINDDVQNGQVTTPHDIIVKGQDMPKTGGECTAVPSTEGDGDGAEFEVCTRVQASGTFTAQAGSWEYECEVPGHAAKGMKGDLVVKGGAATTKTPGFELPAFLGALLLVALARRR